MNMHKPNQISKATYKLQRVTKVYIFYNLGGDIQIKMAKLKTGLTKYNNVKLYHMINHLNCNKEIKKK